jgi:hypothetical protein
MFVRETERSGATLKNSAVCMSQLPAPLAIELVLFAHRSVQSGTALTVQCAKRSESDIVSLSMLNLLLDILCSRWHTRVHARTLTVFPRMLTCTLVPPAKLQHAPAYSNTLPLIPITCLCRSHSAQKTVVYFYTAYVPVF